MTRRNRIMYFDKMRMLACFAVVLIHVVGSYVNKNIGTPSFWVGTVLRSISGFAVPFFMMISGALFLDEKYAYSKKKIISHIKKMVLFYAFWSVFYAVVFHLIVPICRNQAVSGKDFIFSIIEGSYHLWFVWAIVGFYLIVPLLRLWVNKKNEKYVRYFIILAIIFTFVIPQLIKIVSNITGRFELFDDIITTQLRLSYVAGYTAYFLLGWYLNNFDIKHKKLLYILGVAAVVHCVLGTYYFSPLSVFDDLSINVFLISFAMFVFVKSKYKGENCRFVSSVSKHSLGIYAVHPVFINFLFLFYEYAGITSTLVTIPASFIIAFAGAFGTSVVFSRIPFLRRVV